MSPLCVQESYAVLALRLFCDSSGRFGISSASDMVGVVSNAVTLRHLFVVA